MRTPGSGGDSVKSPLGLSKPEQLALRDAPVRGRGADGGEDRPQAVRVVGHDGPGESEQRCHGQCSPVAVSEVGRNE